MAKKDILLDGIVVGSLEATGDPLKDAETVQDFLKERGLHKEVSINDAMYRQANSFAELANSIYKKDLQKSPYKGSSVSPFVVNAAFSIELYLKTIHSIYGNKVKGRHHLANLYRKLPTKGKDFFNKAANDVRPRYKLEPNVDILSSLKDLSKAFEQWRYIYEFDGLSVELQSIRYTMHVAHEACSRVREDVGET